MNAVTIAGLSLLLVSLCGCSKSETPPVATRAASAGGLASSSPHAASGQTLPTKLCGVLRGMVPEVKGMSSIGARTQLVLAIAGAFDSDAIALGTVSSEIDTIATSACPDARQPLLDATQAASLQEAVR